MVVALLAVHLGRAATVPRRDPAAGQPVASDSGGRSLVGTLLPEEPPPEVLRVVDPRRDEGFVGAEACRPCHVEVYRKWEESHHARAMRLPTPENMPAWKGRVQVSLYGRDFELFGDGGRYFQKILEPGEPVAVMPVDLIIGSTTGHWYLTRMDDGALQVLPVGWRPAAGIWFDFIAESMDRAPRPGQPAHWRGTGRRFNYSCQNCHASQIRKNYNPKTKRYETRFGDLSVNCEECHGPGEAHVARWRFEPDWQTHRPGHDLADVSAFGRDADLDACAICHATKDPYAVGFRPGDLLSDHAFVMVPMSPEAFYLDARSSNLNYQWVEHTQSPCYFKGGLTCNGCHDPHGGPHPADLRYAIEASDPLCTRCHQEIAADPGAHTHHPVASRGARCIECHMPKLTITVAWRHIRDHTISSPKPAVAARYGLPDACFDCHKERPVSWSVEWARRWYGQNERVARYVDTMAAAFRFQPEGLPGLREIAADEDLGPTRRAGAVLFLAQMKEPANRDFVVAALDDPSPYVRIAGTLAAEEYPSREVVRALTRRLDDPSRMVRWLAASALVRRFRSHLPEGTARQAIDLYREAYRNRYVAQPDHPRELEAFVREDPVEVLE